MKKLMLGFIFIVLGAIAAGMNGKPSTPDPQCHGTAVDGHVGKMPIHLCMRSAP
jgi:hypothetical protein